MLALFFVSGAWEKLLARGLLAFADGEYARATALLEEYLQYAPADKLAHFLRGHALEHLGELAWRSIDRTRISPVR